MTLICKVTGKKTPVSRNIPIVLMLYRQHYFVALASASSQWQDPPWVLLQLPGSIAGISVESDFAADFLIILE